MSPMGVPVEQKSLAPKLIRETGFGDMTIQLYEDFQGHRFVRMQRGSPMRKTFCPEHFLAFSKAVGEISRLIEEQ